MRTRYIYTRIKCLSLVYKVSKIGKSPNGEHASMETETVRDYTLRWK